MIITVFLVILVANGVSAKHVLVLAEAGNDEKIPIDITVQDGSVITVSGQPYPPQPFFKQSINLYDFDRMNSKTTTKASEDWDIHGKEIKEAELKATVGPKIAEFCSGYNVFWVNRNKKISKLQVRMAKRQFNGSSLSPPRLTFSNGRLNYNFGKGLSANLGGSWKNGGPLVNGGLKYNNGKGLSANLGGTWQHKGSSVSGGLKYNFGKGFSANLGGSWKQGLGISPTAGISWKFGK